MNAPFQPLDGNEARWRKIYDRLKSHAIGSVLTYDDLAEMFPGAELSVIQGAIRRAAKEYLHKDKRALRNVRGQGYRIIDAAEHIHIARAHQKRSMKSLERGHDAVANVDYTGMAPDIRALTEATARALTMQMQFNRTMDVRQRRLEQVVQETVSRQEVHDQAISELKRRLERLENND